MNGFFGNTLKLLAGNITVQVITLLTLPFITRIYDPKSYGVFILLISLVFTFSSAAGFGYEKAMLLPKQKGTVLNLLALTLLIVFSVGTLLMTVVFIFDSQIKSLFEFEDQFFYVALVPVMVVLVGVNKTFVFLLIRENDFSSQAIAKVKQSITSRGIALIGGQFNTGPFWLFFGWLCGYSFAIGWTACPAALGMTPPQ